MAKAETTSLLAELQNLNAPQLRRLLVEHLTQQKLGLYWESNAITRDAALNANVVLPRVVPEFSHTPAGTTHHRNLVIEGDNFDSLRLLRATHAGKIRVIYIDPPYNTGNKDWVYNDKYVGANDRWRHSQWLEFLYQRLVLARELLTSDGVILVSINDENRARLELLMDEVFPGRRAGCFVWRVRSGGNDTKGALLSDNHEHVLVYCNEGFEFKGEGRNEAAYGNPDEDHRGDWQNDYPVGALRERAARGVLQHCKPDTGNWYAPRPRLAFLQLQTTEKPQADPIETIIAEKRILWPANDRTVTYTSEAEIRQAIKAGTAPKQFKIYAEIAQLQKAAENA
ncbi:MAG: site-specific DNA-methyltransferase [Rhodoferax sp.]|nr:site-specific DNA-methyltransferase [Rhodoferax sp.]